MTETTKTRHQASRRSGAAEDAEDAEGDEADTRGLRKKIDPTTHFFRLQFLAWGYPVAFFPFFGDRSGSRSGLP